MTVWQDSLFEAAATEGFTPLTPERHHLAAGAWVDVQRAWLVRSELLFDRLVGSVPWRAERRPMYDRTVDVPRLVAFYDEGMPLPDPRLDEAKRQLCAHYGEHRGAPLCTTGLCLYRNGRDSVAWHGDTIGRATVRETLVRHPLAGWRADPPTSADCRRTESPVPHRQRRSGGDGRILSAHLAACRAQDESTGGSEDQRAVPLVRRSVSACCSAASVSWPPWWRSLLQP